MNENATENPAAAEAVRELLADQLVTEDVADMLVFGADRGIIDPADVPRLHNNWPAVTAFLEESGLQQAWEDDQEQRGVPIVCPDWCTVSHLVPGAHTRPLLGPWEGAIGHATELAVGGKIGVDYSKDQVHPESARAGREYVSIWTEGYDSLEVSPDELVAVAEDFASTLKRAQDRLAEIRGAGGAVNSSEPTAPHDAIRQNIRHALYQADRIDFAQLDGGVIFNIADAAETLDNLCTGHVDEQGVQA